jgi:hypothetical protein
LTVSPSDGAARQPTALISYSHDSEEHEERVLALANRLRADGIDCEIDQYIPGGAPPEGWPRWMEARIEESDFTLMICTPTYARRVLRQEAADRGRGVVWEATLLYNLLYHDDAFKAKAVPILMGEGTVRDIPLPFRDNFCDLRAPEGYAQLLQRLYRRSRAQKPTLGDAAPAPPPRPAKAAVLPAAESPFNPAELDAMTKALASYIGPIAQVVVARSASQAASRQELIEMLARELDSDAERAAFRVVARRTAK